ncbi:hypothetical protein ACTXT7_013647 [Hymenolepis weldensis]
MLMLENGFTFIKIVFDFINALPAQLERVEQDKLTSTSLQRQLRCQHENPLINNQARCVASFTTVCNLLTLNHDVNMETDDRLDDLNQRYFNPDETNPYGPTYPYSSPLQRLLDYTTDFHQGNAGNNQNGVS